MEKGFSKALGKTILKLLFRGGAIVSTDNEVVQASLRGLTSIFHSHLRYIKKSKDDESQAANNKGDKSKKIEKANKLPFPAESIRSLVELLTTSVMEITSSYQNASFQLIKAIVEANVLLPEVYDLMNKLIEQSVLSHRKGVRDSASSTIITYILSYPLSEKRMASHIKQFLKNCSFDYEEGRLSALSIIESLVKLFPAPILLEYAKMIFLFLSLRVVNDPSVTCRQKCAEVIVHLVRRVDAQTYNSLLEYTTTWLNAGRDDGEMTHEARSLIRTGAQMAGLMVEARSDLFKKATGVMSGLVELVRTILYRLP